MVRAAQGPITATNGQMQADQLSPDDVVTRWGGAGNGISTGSGSEYVVPTSAAVPPIPIIGNGDILSWQDYYGHMGHNVVDASSNSSSASSSSRGGSSMTSNNEAPFEDDDSTAGSSGTGVVATLLARGALIKPWLPREIKERTTLDIRSSERLEILRSFVNYGLDNWGSDQAGVNRTRRFLLEWLSFTCRYVPVGLLERTPQRMNERPPAFVGRDDLETLMGSQHAEDWVKLR